MSSPASPYPAAAPPLARVTRAFLRRDMPELWIGWLAVMAATVFQLRPSDEWVILVDVFVVLLTARWVLADPPGDPDAFWRTLPVSPGRLMAIKAGTMLIAMLPLLGLQAHVMARAGLGGERLALVLLESAVHLALLVTATAAAAAHTRDFPRFVVLAMAILLAALACTSGTISLAWKLLSPATRGVSPAWLATGLELAALPLLAAGMWAAATGRFRVASRALPAAAFALLCVLNPLVWALTAPATPTPAVAEGVRISLVDVGEDLDPAARRSPWPSGLAVGVRVAAPEDVTVAIQSVGGSLRLDDGRVVPVRAEMNPGRTSITWRPAGDSALRIVELIDQQKLQRLDLREASGRLTLDVGYRIGARVPRLPSSTFRIVRTDLAPPTLRVAYESVVGAGEPWETGGEQLRIWNADRTAGFLLTATGSGGPSARIGVLTRPEVRVRIARLEFDLTRATALPSGESVDASALVTGEMLAASRLELSDLRWASPVRQRIAIPEFRVAEWLR